MKELEHIGDYKLIRKIGEGGFGIVYLALKNDSDKFVAIKLISAPNAKKESDALKAYSKLSGMDSLMPILDEGIEGEHFFYVMPLADSMNPDFKCTPEDIRFIPKTLANLIAEKQDSPTSKWFTAEEILDLMKSIFSATSAIGNKGLLHRDIKPDNIIFVDGKPYLSDFGLLENDRRSLSNAGTPYFIAPKWYLNSGGNPDMWGLATTFYMLITGNYPDSMGRAAYNLPLNSEKNMSQEEYKQWAHWHRCILRATAEIHSDRYLTIDDFWRAIASQDFSISLKYSNSDHSTSKNRRRINWIWIGAILALLFFLLFAIYHSFDISDNKITALSETQENENHILQLKIFAPQMVEIYRNGYTDSEKNLTIYSFKDWLVFFDQEAVKYAKWREDRVKRLEELKNNHNADPTEIMKLKSWLNFRHTYEGQPSLAKYMYYVEGKFDPMLQAMSWDH